MPFHFYQANPQNTQLPPMADRRLPSISIPPPPGPNSHAGAGDRITLPPLNLPPISQLNPPYVTHPSTNSSYRYLIPPAPAPQFGSNVPLHPFYVFDTASFRGAGGPSNASSSALPAGNHALIRGEVGRLDYNLPWVKTHLSSLEVYARIDLGEEKGKAYLGLWLAIREKGWPDEPMKRFIAKELMPYSWFKGDDTAVRVALQALIRLDFINAGLLAKKHAEKSKELWDRRIGNVRVRDFWTEEAAKLRQKVQAQQAAAQAHAQAQAQAQTQAQAQAQAEAQR